MALNGQPPHSSNHEQRDDGDYASRGSLQAVGKPQKPDRGQDIMLKRDLELAQKLDRERFGSAPLRQRAHQTLTPQIPDQAQKQSPTATKTTTPTVPAAPTPANAAPPMRPEPTAKAIDLTPPVRQEQAVVSAMPTTTSSGSSAQQDPHMAEIAALQAKLDQLKAAAALKEQIGQLQAQRLPQPSESAQQPQVQSRPQYESKAKNATPHDPREPSNPDHQDFQAIHSSLTKAGQWREPQTTNISASLLAHFRAQQFGTRVDTVGVDTDPTGKTRVFAGYAPWGEKQGCLGISITEPAQAAKIPAEQSFDRLAQINTQQQIAAPQHAQQQKQATRMIGQVS
jgi:hypothetical protein